jgi:hypothetical protein
VVEATVSQKGSALEVGTPRQLFQAPLAVGSGTANSYAIAPEGDRYLVLLPIQRSTTPLTLVTNWSSALER